MSESFNNRILIIDDDENIRDSFRDILTPTRADTTSLDDARGRLFGKASSKKKTKTFYEFELSEAVSGQEGLAKVEAAQEAKTPFAVIFVDMRMPGWDGLETVGKIREVDEVCEIIFVTAYSDHGIDEIVSQAGANVGYHCKPFAVEEILQLATKAVFDWNRSRDLERVLEMITDLRVDIQQTNDLLTKILEQVCELLYAPSALILKRDEDTTFLLGTGSLGHPDEASKVIKAIQKELDSLTASSSIIVKQIGDYCLMTLSEYDILVLFDKPGEPLGREKTHIVRLFLTSAAELIRNAKLHEELKRKEKLSTLGKAVSMINHDLRNPLATITSVLSLLEDETCEEGMKKEWHRVIRLQTEQALQLIEDMLSYVQGKALNLKAFDLSDLIQRLREFTEALAQNSPFKFSIQAEEEIVMHADQNKLFHVFSNLIRNAAEALHDSHNQTTDPTLSLLAKLDQHEVLVSVRDNGPGIPLEIRDKLFEAFETYGKSGGTGLGMAIAKNFVEAHGGHIDFESTKGNTVFRVRLPVHAILMNPQGQAR